MVRGKVRHSERYYALRLDREEARVDPIGPIIGSCHARSSAQKKIAPKINVLLGTERNNLPRIVVGTHLWRTAMPVLLWLLGVPLVVVIALMLTHVI